MTFAAVNDYELMVHRTVLNVFFFITFYLQNPVYLIIMSVTHKMAASVKLFSGFSMPYNFLIPQSTCIHFH